MKTKQVFNRSFALLTLLAVMLGVLPATGKSADAQVTLKVAVMIPRSPEVAIRSARYNQRLAGMTNNYVQVRVYWGGAAGDDTDVLRKIRTGQMDGAPLGLELLSSFVRQALVLNSPALFNNYKQVDAARAALTPAMDAEAYQNGFRVMGWGDVGRLRLMSKKPVSRLSDFKNIRPWLYPHSEMLKEFYRAIGATGVPLEVAEVYAGLQTNMIDLVWTSALLGAALQWHTTTHYISEKGLGFISGAFIYRRPAWDQLPEKVRDAMQYLSDDERQKNQIDVRKDDERAFQKLLKRGFEPLRAANEQEWWDAGHALRRKMIGRVYTKELVEKAEQITAKYKEPGQEH